MRKFVATSSAELAHTPYSQIPCDFVGSIFCALLMLTFSFQKMDLGACPKSHTERLKTEFLAAREANPSDPIFAKFQTEYENNIFAFVDECDRRIRTAQRRLEKTPEENAKTTNLVC
jgi:LUC7 N_terminus